jgi:hypothetical protein
MGPTSGIYASRSFESRLLNGCMQMVKFADGDMGRSRYGAGSMSNDDGAVSGSSPTTGSHHEDLSAPLGKLTS